MGKQEIEIDVEQNDENGFIATVWNEDDKCLCTITNELFLNFTKDEIFKKLQEWGVQEEGAEKCYSALTDYYYN
jgi:hypothetical protein